MTSDTDIRNPDFLWQLEQIIAERKRTAPENSYTASLFARGGSRIAQKLGEEGVELAIASVENDRQNIVSESADLVYHLLVLLQHHGLTIADVSAELERRHGQAS